jgi:AcrR family transcriptional regulator
MTTTGERPQRADARRNRAQLIAAARTAFQRHGLQAPLDDIARQAGVGPGTLYRHFPTREDLLAAVYRDDVAAISARSEQFAAELPPMEALTAWLRSQLEYISHTDGLGAAIKAMLGNDTETMEWCRQNVRGAAARLLEPVQREGLVRADVDPASLLRLVHAIGLATETAPEQADLMLSIVLKGLRP